MRQLPQSSRLSMKTLQALSLERALIEDKLSVVFLDGLSAKPEQPDDSEVVSPLNNCKAVASQPLSVQSLSNRESRQR